MTKAEFIKKEDMEAGNEPIDADTAHSESMGFFKGERKEQIEKVQNKIWEIIKEEELSLTQAESVIQGLSSMVRKEKQKAIANITIK